MTHGDGHITECAGYVRVDFGGCSSAELSEGYRDFAALCIDKQASRALLKAGDDYPPGHYALRTALYAMATRTEITPDFKPALIPSTPCTPASVPSVGSLSLLSRVRFCWVAGVALWM